MTQSPYVAGAVDEPGRDPASPAELLASSRDPDDGRVHRDSQRFEAALRERLDRLLPSAAWRAVAVALAVGLVAGHLWGAASPTAEASQAGSGAGSAAPSRSPSPSPSRSGGAVLPPPVVGLCHQYSREAEGAANEESAPVPCAGDHDAVTVARVDRPGIYLPYDGAYIPASEAMVTCQQAAERYLGIGPGVTFTRYSSAVYEPDQAQLDAGQRWLRCDLVKFPTFLGLMPLRGQLRNSMRKGPDLNDAFCVRPDALAEGLPLADRMEAPELGDWGGQADCFGTHALVAVRRAPAESPSRAAGACTTASHRFRGLRLTALVPPPDEWLNEVLCVAHISDYESWLARGKPLV